MTTLSRILATITTIVGVPLIWHAIMPASSHWMTQGQIACSIPLTRFGNAIGIKTHSIYTHEYEGDPGREYEAYQAIQAACIAMDELEPGDDPF